MNIIYTQYFETVKRQGNQDPKFLQRINGAFICLVATTIRHSLKAFRTGAHDEKGPACKYEKAYCKLQNCLRRGKANRGSGTFQRLEATWDLLGTEIQGLIVANTNSDIAHRIAASTKLLEIEPTNALQVRTLQAFKAKWQRNLEHSNNRLGVPKHKRQRAYSQLRYSSVELEGELDPAISSELKNFDPLSSADTDQGSQESSADQASQENSVEQDSQKNSTNHDSQESSTGDEDGDEDVDRDGDEEKL